MRTLVRVPLVLHLLVTLAACGELVGIGDVPTPADGSADAAAPEDATDSTDNSALDAAGAPRGAPSDTGPGGEGPDGDGSTDDVSSAAVDGGSGTPITEAAAPEVSTEAVGDAAACTATWDPYDSDCNTCGIAMCCAQLATCEVVDDAGLDRGMSRCATLVYCIAGYTGTVPPMSGDGLCKMDDQYSPSELADEDAALSCIRTQCSASCPGL
jgi:predicted small lipoprotein YifL